MWEQLSVQKSPIGDDFYKLKETGPKVYLKFLFIL